MDEGYFLRCRVYAAAAWILALVLMIAGWIVLLFDPDDWRIAGGLGVTGCAVVGVAATLQVRSFHVRVCALIRVASGLGQRSESDVGLRPIR